MIGRARDELRPTVLVLSDADTISVWVAQTDLEGAQRAQELYGDDADRELAALAAGTHPFQRELDADALAASRREAAALLAAGA